MCELSDGDGQRCFMDDGSGQPWRPWAMAGFLLPSS